MIRAIFRQVNWTVNSTEDVEALWRRISETIHEVVERLAPPIVPRRHALGPPWFDDELRSCLRRRNRAWKIFRRSGEGYDSYKAIRNQCNALKHAKRINYEERLAEESRVTPKPLFAYFRRRTRMPIGFPALTDPTGRVAETATEKANIFVQHYASVYTKECTQLHAPLSTPLRGRRFSIDEFTVEDVIGELRSLDTQKSAGPDNIHPRVLKELAVELAPTLTHLFNLSVASGRNATE